VKLKTMYFEIIGGSEEELMPTFLQVIKKKYMKNGV
jgi:hypothetical protein